MDYDNYNRPAEGPSLAVKLMQVAGEWELAKKREIQSWQGKLADKEAALLRAERLLRDANEKNQELTRNIARAEEELEHAATKADDSVNGLQHTLLSVRFQLAERLQQLDRLQDAYLELQRGVEQALVAVDVDDVEPAAENAENGEQQALVRAKRAVAGPVSALRTLVANSQLPAHKVAEVRAAAKEASRWSPSALLAAVKAGAEAEVVSLLTGAPSHGRGGIEEHTGLPPALRGAVTQGLRLAVSTGNIGMVKLLLSAGADLSHRSIEDGLLHDALHVASGAGQEAMMRYLLGRDANGAAISRDQAPAAAAGLSIDVPDSYGRTCLHLAAAADSASTVKLLLMVGADPDCKDVHGHTAAEVAQGTEEYSKAEKPAQAGRKPEGWAYASGELPVHGKCPSALAILTDPNLSFWNASVRANRYYNEKAFEKAIGAYSKALELAPLCSMPTSARDMATLHYNRARARYRIGAHVAAVEDCTAALNKDSSYRNALAQRAECYMSLFDLERAARDFQSLLEADPSDRQWGRRLTEARAMRDMSHYGVLGVPKDADGAAIKKAYRALCLRWHPDKVEQGSAGGGQGSPIGEGGDGSAGIGRQEASLRANIVFRRLTDAYETLSDTYKRMIYDMDPRSNNSTPSAATMAAAARAAAAGGVGAGAKGAGAATGGPREGFEKWATKELEREEERDRERMSAAAVHAAQALAEEEARASARAMRVRMLASAAQTPSTTSLARTSGAPKPAPAPVPAAPKPALPHSASMGPSTSASVRATAAAAAGGAPPSGSASTGSAAGPAPVPQGMGGAAAHAASPNTHGPPLLRRAASDGALPAASQPVPPARPTPGQAACPSPPARRVRVGDGRAGPASPSPVPSDEAAAAVRNAYGSTTGSVMHGANEPDHGATQAQVQEQPAGATPSASRSEGEAATGNLQAAAAATAARARAAVAQAEAFVRLVQQQAAEGGLHVPTHPASSSAASTSSTDSHHEDGGDEQGDDYESGAYRSSADFMAGLDKAALRARVAARARGESGSALPASSIPLPSTSTWPSASVTQPVDMSGLEGLAGYDGDEGSDDDEGEEGLSVGDLPSAGGEGSSLGEDLGGVEEPHVQVGEGYSLDQEAELLRRLDAAAAAAAAAVSSSPMGSGSGPGTGAAMGGRYRPMDDRELTALLERLGM